MAKGTQASKTILTRLVILVILIAQSPFLIGCKTMVPPGSRIAIPEGVREQRNAQTEDVSLNYSYDRTNSTLEIQGDLRFVRRLGDLQYFNLRLLILDAKGNVLHSVGLASAGDGGSGDGLSFHKSLQWPENATCVAFAYQGMTRLHESGGGVALSQLMPN
jgi:hypothetical protein